MTTPPPQPKLIALDMDGTLLGSDGRVSPRNLSALRRAEEAGIEIVIATGRRHCYAMHVLRELDLHPASPLVSSNGAVIRSIGSELLHRTPMPLATARWMCAHATEFRDSLVLTFDTVQPGGEDTRGALVVEDIANLNATIGRWMESNAPYIASVRPIEDSLHGDPPIQMMLCGPIERMARAEALLLEHPLVALAEAALPASAPPPEIVLHRTEYPGRDLCILDILPAGCSKASALQHLADLRGIAPSNILAIGDNWNDLPMLEFAGSAILMANAPAALQTLARQRGWTVGPSNDEHGVAQALEAILETARKPSREPATEAPAVVVS